MAVSLWERPRSCGNAVSRTNLDTATRPDDLCTKPRFGSMSRTIVNSYQGTQHWLGPYRYEINGGDLRQPYVHLCMTVLVWTLWDVMLKIKVQQLQ